MVTHALDATKPEQGTDGAGNKTVKDEIGDESRRRRVGEHVGIASHITVCYSSAQAENELDNITIHLQVRRLYVLLLARIPDPASYRYVARPRKINESEHHAWHHAKPATLQLRDG